ncbi:putative drug resistance protein [Cladorrhinum sp. PSN259]|nr:putative drug resistance protein [Cladorrhinum sp. PSN259]
MENRRQRSSSWADVTAVDAMQRATDVINTATASIRLQYDGEADVSRSSRPGPDSSLSEPRSSRCRVDIVQNQSPLGRIANGRDLLRSRPVSANRPPSNSTRKRTPPPLPPNPTITRPEQQQQQYHVHIHQRPASRRVRSSSWTQHHQPQEPQNLELEHLRPVPPPHVHLPNAIITNVSDYYDDPSTHLAFQPSTLLLHNESSSTIIPPSDPEDSQTSLLSYYFPSAETLPTSSTPCPSANNKPTLPKKKPVPISKLPPSSSLSSSSSPSSSSPKPHPAVPSPPPPPAAGRPPSLTSPLHENLFVLLICLAQILMLAGLAQAMVPSAIISRSFANSDPQGRAIPWYSAAYGLTSATFVLPSGRVGDLWGHRKVFVTGLAWFGIWSLITGFAGMAEINGSRGEVFFCVGRGLQGIGPALLVPSGQALLGRTYPPSMRKNMVLCLFGASAPLGFVSGAIFSSLFAERGAWPWAFWTMAILCFLLAIISLFVLPFTGPPGLKPNESLWTQLDGYGMLLGVSGLVLLNFAFNQAPIVSWKTPYTYFLLIIGILLLAAFVWHEGKAAVYPLIPISAMKPATNFVLGCTGAGWACFSIWVYYCCNFLEMMRGWSPVLTGVGFIPAILVGFLMSRIKPHWIMLISMCAFFIGSLLLATTPVRQSYWLNTFFGILIMPFGMDMSNPAATILLSNSVSKEHQGIAASLVVTTVNYSISLALGIAGTIEVVC